MYIPNYVSKSTEKEDKYKLQKRRSSINWIYFNLKHDGKTIGTAWVRKRISYIKKGMYIYIEPKYRQKGYGTIFYNLLAGEMADRNIPFVILKVNKRDKIASNFIEKQIDKHDDRFSILNKKVYIYDLIIDG